MALRRAFDFVVVGLIVNLSIGIIYSYPPPEYK